MTDFIQLTKPVYVKWTAAELIKEGRDVISKMTLFSENEMADDSKNEYVELRTVPPAPKNFGEMLMAGMKVHREENDHYWMIEEGCIISREKKHQTKSSRHVPPFVSTEYVEYKPRKYYSGEEALRMIFDGKKMRYEEYRMKDWCFGIDDEGAIRIGRIGRPITDQNNCFVSNKLAYESQKWYEVEND